MIGNAAGGVVATYFIIRGLEKETFIGTGALLFLIMNGIKLPLYAFVWKVITVQSLLQNLIVLPAVMLGVFTGYHIITHIPMKLYHWVIIITTLASGIALIC